MAVKEKTMNTKLYAVIVFFAVAAVLTASTIFVFTSKYTAFKPEKVAQAYVDSIVQNGDGYNAYKYSLVSKSEKYGDFIRNYYMNPIIYKEAGYKPGDSTKDMKGLNDKANMSEKTKNDDGALSGQVIDQMYPFYVKLISEYSWDNYNEVFSQYFAQFQKVRAQVFGDNYLSDEVMFTALESNLKTYGESLTGTEEVYDENTNVKLSDKTIGTYQKKYGEDYAFTVTTKDVKNMDDVNNYISAMDSTKLETYGVVAKDISAVCTCTVEVALSDGTVLAQQPLNVVKIGNTWYVDNTNSDMSEIYSLAL